MFFLRFPPTFRSFVSFPSAAAANKRATRVPGKRIKKRKRYWRIIKDIVVFRAAVPSFVHKPANKVVTRLWSVSAEAGHSSPPDRVRAPSTARPRPRRRRVMGHQTPDLFLSIFFSLFLFISICSIQYVGRRPSEVDQHFVVVPSPIPLYYLIYIIYTPQYI